MELLTLFNPFAKSPPRNKPIDDTTLYQIITLSNSYCGRIAHQDGVVIKLQSKEGRPVKILKQNIRSNMVITFNLRNI